MDRVLYPQNPLRLRLDQSTSRGGGGYFYTCSWYQIDIRLSAHEGLLVGVGLAKDRDLLLSNPPEPELQDREFDGLCEEQFEELSKISPGLQIVSPEHAALPRHYILETPEGLRVDARTKRPYVVLRNNPISLAVYQVERYCLWAHVIFSSLDVDGLNEAGVWPKQAEAYYTRLFDLHYAATMLFDVEI